MPADIAWTKTDERRASIASLRARAAMLWRAARSPGGCSASAACELQPAWTPCARDASRSSCSDGSPAVGTGLEPRALATAAVLGDRAARFSRGGGVRDQPRLQLDVLFMGRLRMAGTADARMSAFTSPVLIAAASLVIGSAARRGGCAPPPGTRVLGAVLARVPDGIRVRGRSSTSSCGPWPATSVAISCSAWARVAQADCMPVRYFTGGSVRADLVRRVVRPVIVLVAQAVCWRVLARPGSRVRDLTASRRLVSCTCRALP